MNFSLWFRKIFLSFYKISFHSKGSERNLWAKSNNNICTSNIPRTNIAQTIDIKEVAANSFCEPNFMGIVPFYQMGESDIHGNSTNA